MAKFKIGDRVQIVKYGSLIWENKKHGGPMFTSIPYFEDEKMRWHDMDPQLVGKIGIVDQVTETQGKGLYGLSGVNKVAWYNEEQLKLVTDEK